MKTVYMYDELTHEYIGPTYLQVDDVASARMHETVYMEKPCTTDIAPPTAKFPDKVAVFNTFTRSWDYVPDYRGKRIINVDTKVVSICEGITLPTGGFYLFDIPSDTVLKYCKYDRISTKWVIDDRKKILDDIWELRKEIRDAQCNADLEYQGHMYHVDQVSLNDITLAAQDCMFSGDMSLTRRWVTADDVSVTVTGLDLVAILKLYGVRRQTLVYNSNEAWQHDTTLSDNELLALYDRLSSEV